jgi:hypothetical protein
MNLMSSAIAVLVFAASSIACMHNTATVASTTQEYSGGQGDRCKALKARACPMDYQPVECFDNEKFVKGSNACVAKGNILVASCESGTEIAEDEIVCVAEKERAVKQKECEAIGKDVICTREMNPTTCSSGGDKPVLGKGSNKCLAQADLAKKLCWQASVAGDARTLEKLLKDARGRSKAARCESVMKG